MKKEDIVVIAICGLIVLIFLVVIYGNPQEITFAWTPPFIEMSWKTEDETRIAEPQPTPPLLLKNNEIKIESFKMRQEIYQPRDNVIVDFKITNELNIPYNITVDWLYNNTRYHGWYNISTNFYNTTDTQNQWWSNYTVQKIGDWEVHLIINYSLRNEIITKDDVAKFRVI